MPVDSLNVQALSPVAQLKWQIDQRNSEVSELHQAADWKNDESEGTMKHKPHQFDLAVNDESEEEHNARTINETKPISEERLTDDVLVDVKDVVSVVWQSKGMDNAELRNVYV